MKLKKTMITTLRTAREVVMRLRIQLLEVHPLTRNWECFVTLRPRTAYESLSRTSRSKTDLKRGPVIFNLPFVPVASTALLKRLRAILSEPEAETVL